MAVSNPYKPLVYRLEEIPPRKSKEDLLLLFPQKIRDRMTVTSLSRSINLNRRTSTATISFSPLSQEPFPMPSDPDICIDRDFYGFTPLYTPDGHIAVDIIAITGLAGHAFGSWFTATQKMWLRDFLPRDIPEARILLYGYDSHIVNSQSRSILADFSSNFIAKFSAMQGQSHCEDRPVIFIGHSLGCLMIKEVLIDLGSYLDRRAALTRPTVKSIIFFGAPHRGLAVTAMQSMVQGTPSEDLIGELKMHSPTLTRLNDGFHRVYEDVSILTIYEMEPTASLCKNGFDTWERSGPPVMMVEKDSAILYWPTETRIGLNQDHSRIAKVERGQNGCYDDICHFLQRSLVSSDKANTVPIVKPPKLPSSDLPSSRKGKIVMGRRLREAIKNGDSETARDLIGKDPHTRVPGNPLSLAVEFCPEIVSTLLDAGANVSATGGEEGGQAIHTAAKHAKSHKIVQLLLDAGADVNARDSIDDKIPLHHAARYNDKPEIVQYLIDAGATVNAPARDRQTPLHSAALWTSNPEVLRVLIDAGATVNARANEGYTPLHAAALDNRNPEVLRVLIDAGATVNASTKEKSTPLHYAALYNSNPEVLRVLIDAGATVNAPGKKKCTPLHYAASYNSNPEILQILIDAGATVNVSDRDGYTSLHCAARWNNSPEVCHELLTAGAPLEQKDSGGYTALHLAVSHGNKAVVVHLLKWGADPRAKSKSGVAPADAAFHESVPPVTRIEIRKLTRSALQV